MRHQWKFYPANCTYSEPQDAVTVCLECGVECDEGNESEECVPSMATLVDNAEDILPSTY
jgi:hypothetical protein